MKYLLVLFALVLSLNAKADIDVGDLEVRYKISSLMIQAQEQILEIFKDQDPRIIHSAAFQDQWEKEIKALTESLIIDQLKIAKAAPSEISKTRKILKAMKWRKVSSFLIRQVSKLKVLTRVHGISLVMFCIVTNVAQLIVPTFLTNAGYPILALVSVLATGNVPSVMYHSGVTYFSKLKRAFKNFKGAENFKRYTRVLKEVKKNLSGAELADLIIPYQNLGGGDAVVIRKEGMVRKSLVKMGFLKDSITIKSLNNFLEKEEITDPVLRAIMKSDAIESDVKIGLALNYMDTNLESSILVKYKTKFHKSFIPIHTSGREQLAFDWVKLVLESKGASDFDQAFKRIPSEMHPIEIHLLWEQIVLPHFSKNSSAINYTQFRNLIYSAESMKADIFINERTSMVASNRALFSKYFQKAMKTSSKNCFNGHDKILKTLLQYP